MSGIIYVFISSALCLKAFLADSDNHREVTDSVSNYLRFFNPQNNLITIPDKMLKLGLQQYDAGLNNEDISLNVSQLIQKYVGKVEEHEVQTVDGYKITLIRIPNKGPVVFLMHGLLGSADDWVIPGIDSGIAYLLANDGYDVWMGNARGNKHSNKHQTLDASSYQFWDFSWDEIGRYDLPASIDYMLEKTDQSQLIYVGHSQGTTAFLVMCSELPEYNDKVSLMIALTAPTANSHMKSPFLNFLKYVTLWHPDMLISFIREMGLYEFLPTSDIMRQFQSRACGSSDLAKVLCNNVVFVICGFDPEQTNMTNLPVVFSHSPSGAATKQIQHYAQTAVSGKFHKFDCGEDQNMHKYGSKSPPEYPVEKITAPMAIFYSDNDWLVSLEDVEILKNRLPNVIDFYRVPYNKFNHIDYLYGIDLKQLVYSRMISIMKEHVDYFRK